MSEKFTRGPWFVLDLGQTKDGNPHFIVQAGGPNIEDGFVDDEYFSLSGIMTRETATLISAAPDLYAALKGLYEVLYAATDGDRVWTMEKQQAARDALAKARGES